VNLHCFPNAVGPEQADAPIYFLHIPKTAGLTLSAFLETLFVDSEFWHCGRDRWSWESILKLTPDELRSFQIINGHFAGYLYKHYPLPLRYLTFLRDPLARAVSHHEHVLRDEMHYFHSLARELGSFGAYLRDERTQPTVVNFELRCLGTTFDPAELVKSLTAEQVAQRDLERRLDTMPFTQSPSELLKTAQARLDQMCFVGLTEQFADSLGLICEVFGWPRPDTIDARNVNPRTMSLKDLPGADVRLLKRLNEADIELYQSAKARFERDWARSHFVYPQLHAFVSYAQNAEDVLLHRVLRDTKQGTYIDVGANDPCGDSVTKAFYDRGWRGINIEPVTLLYQALLKQRPEDVNIHAAAGASTAEMTLYEIPGTGLSTLDASIADRHRNQGFKINETRVQVRTLRAILADLPPTDIHFLKIDVEGWEREVLEGIDLASTRPWIILVEATEPNTEIPSYREWEPLLFQHEYLFVFFDGLNRYYLAREKRNLKKAFSRPVNSGDVFIKASEASAVRALRDAQWSLRKQRALARERENCIAGATQRAQSTEDYAKALERERDEAMRQIDGLTKWATSADAAGKARLIECESLRSTLKTVSDAREAELVEATRQIEELTRWAKSADTYGKHLAVEIVPLREECESLRGTLKTVSDARDAERAEAARQIEELTRWAESADTYGKHLAGEIVQLREKWQQGIDASNAAQELAQRQIEELTARCALMKESSDLLLEEREQLQQERNNLESELQALAQRLAREEESVARISIMFASLGEHQAQLAKEWQAERDVLEQSVARLEKRLTELNRHWAVKLLVNKQHLSRIEER
jgi:FkbM family methyltransferase